MFIEHPDFLRFACLDPTPVPAPNSLGDSLAPVVRSSTSVGLVVHRPAWITFRAEPSCESSEDLTEFCASLVDREGDKGEATDPVLLSCLSAARILPTGPFCQERVRPSTRLSTALFAVAGSSVNQHPIAAKSVMRRHLVMAARLIARLDDVSGLWKKEITENPEDEEGGERNIG